MRYQKVYNRVKGSIETFSEDATVVADDDTVVSMTASIVSGTSISIVDQSYSSVSEALTYQVSFSNIGSTILKVVTVLSSDDEIVTTYLFRSTDDGTGIIPTDYT